MVDFVNFLSPGRKGHLIGIGGVSMSSLAEVLQGMGISVTGSDMNESPNVRALREHGIPVAIGHRAENVAPERFERMQATLKVRDVIEPLWVAGMAAMARETLTLTFPFVRRSALVFRLAATMK